LTGLCAHIFLDFRSTVSMEWCLKSGHKCEIQDSEGNISFLLLLLLLTAFHVMS